MPPQMRRTKWKQDEVKQMLSFIEHRHAEQLMASTCQKNQNIYIAVAKNLKKKGYERTPEQCRAKFKHLKTKFMDALEARQYNPRKTCYSLPHYKQFLCLWETAGRPRRKDHRNEGSSGEQRRPQEESVATANLPAPVGTTGNTNQGILEAVKSLEVQVFTTKRNMTREMESLEKDMQHLKGQLGLQ